MSSSPPPEDHSNTKTNSVTTTFHEKRSRRVSFAENTSVHIFDRDEESGSIPDAEEESRSSPDGKLGFGRDSDDEDGEDRSPFFRVVRSPSSGGSTTLGSVTSNDDEDNFFGPVSTSFIRRDLSDSAASDDNHYQTMDSTSFSMHFRSIARSESESELKTSTGVHLFVEEKTPTGPTRSSVPSNKGSSMLLTLKNRPNNQPDISTSKLSSVSNSNDMSLVGEYHDKYNYGNLSPALSALLAEDHNDLHAVSHISMLKSPINAGTQVLSNKENGSDLVDISYGPENKMEGITGHQKLNEVISAKHSEKGMANDGSKLFSNNQNAFGLLSDTRVCKPLPLNHSISMQEPIKGAFGNNSSVEALATSQCTPSNPRNLVYQLDDVMEKENTYPLLGSITHSSDRPSHMLLNGGTLYKSPRTVTPSHKQASFSPRTESLQHVGSVSSLRKSMSRLRIIKTSPFSAALTAKLEDSNSRSLYVPARMSPFSTLLEKNEKSRNMDNNTEIPKNLVPITREENFVEVGSLPSEHTFSGQHTQSEFMKSADVGYGCEYDENKICSGHVGGLDENISNKRVSTPLDGAGTNIEEIVHERAKFSVNSGKKVISNNIEYENFQSGFRGSDNTMGQMKASHLFRDKSCQKNLADQFGTSPSNKERCNVLHNNSIDSLLAENVRSIERKRKTEDVNTEKIAKIKMSINSGLESLTDSEMSSIGPNLEHLAKINTSFFNEANLLSHSVDKMNLHAIDRLVDILGQLQRSKTYQLLSDEIQSQNIVNSSSNTQNKRSAETKLFLCKIVYEQAKLQLMHVKQERLLKNVQSVASGIQEFEALKLNHSPQNSIDVQLIHLDTIKEIQECQVENNKVTSMSEEIKDIDKRISSFTKSFNLSCKMKEEHSPTDTIALVNDHMMKRARCQIIRKDLQLWVLDDLKSNKDHHAVDLNYLHLIYQRLKVAVGVVPSISISNILNEMNIHKSFKDMNASTAFGFVFDVGLIQKHLSATSLAKETQMTSHILGNLVDVMEEIQLARIELKNLINTRFHTSDERLNLEIYFFNSNSQKKATLTLDTSCLKRGIYPSEIVACQIDIPVYESQKSSTQTLSTEITSAIQDLRVGCFRILRLCRCISQLVSLQGKH